MDILTKEERSKRMSLIRSRWTKPEKWVHNHLKGRKIIHKMHPRMYGSPDVIFPEKKVALFLHGCFWHGCKKCYNEPVNNSDFWKNKVRLNMERDKKNNNLLKSEGWEVRIVWEHEISRHNPDVAIKEILDGLFPVKK